VLHIKNWHELKQVLLTSENVMYKHGQ